MVTEPTDPENSLAGSRDMDTWPGRPVGIWSELKVTNNPDDRNGWRGCSGISHEGRAPVALVRGLRPTQLWALS